MKVKSWELMGKSLTVSKHNEMYSVVRLVNNKLDNLLTNKPYEDVTDWFDYFIDKEMELDR